MTKSWRGWRPGSGPHRRRLYLDAETARLLAKHRQRLNQPDLSNEEAVKRLLLTVQIQPEEAQAVVMQTVHEVPWERWPTLVQQILSGIGLQLEELATQSIEQLQPG